jgi:hypothetical protein
MNILYAILAIVVYAVIRKLIVGKGSRTDQQEILNTVMIFTTSVPISVCRGQLPMSTRGGVRVSDKSGNQIVYDTGGVDQGLRGFRAIINFREATGGGTEAEFRFTTLRDGGGGVSPYFKVMTELRNEVTAAFQSADPNVQIGRSTQSMTSKTKLGF